MKLSPRQGQSAPVIAMQGLLSPSGINAKADRRRDDWFTCHGLLYLSVPVRVGRGQHSISHVNVRLVRGQLDARIRACEQARGSLGRVWEEPRRVDFVSIEIGFEFCLYTTGQF